MRIRRCLGALGYQEVTLGDRISCSLMEVDQMADAPPPAPSRSGGALFLVLVTWGMAVLSHPQSDMMFRFLSGVTVRSFFMFSSGDNYSLTVFPCSPFLAFFLPTL